MFVLGQSNPVLVYVRVYARSFPAVGAGTHVGWAWRRCRNAIDELRTRRKHTNLINKIVKDPAGLVWAGTAVVEGVNLASQRHRSGFTQEEVAMRSGLHRTEISLLERGERVPLLDTLVRVAAGVEGEPCELLAGLAWPSDYSRLYSDAEGRLEIQVGPRWEEV